MKIAVFWPNWIGDAVMATPAVKALRARFPSAHILGVLRPYIAGVVEGSHWHDRYLFLNTQGSWRNRWLAVAARLRREQVDLAVLFPNSFRSALTAWAGRCKKRLGYRRYGRSLFLTDGLEPVRDARGKLTPSPVIEAYNQLAVHADCADPGYQMELFTTPADEAAAAAVWQIAGFEGFEEIICLNPGAAFGSAKFWPAEYFADLAQRLHDRRGSRVLVLCGPPERAIAQRIVALADRPGIRSLAEQPLCLGLTKACVKKAHLLITTDSGPRHFAAAFNRPVITLFGPTHIAWTETYFEKAVHLQKRVDCGPCQRRQCPLDHRCMNLLTPAEVFGAANDLLTRCERRAAS